ncbi:hypothetical protein F7725_026873 [Dissostichus mawsoni]|uniref:Uncharacterized protein n=1 Tax=Dissostichus mawsoni TaxID=36200 RepID=A0A7J5X9U6_DISMA|nr:hypothetical protein F7725_026873 [Dissostichus mawsoni]
MSGTLPGPFFFFSLARMEDSLSGNGGISSSTVACGGTETSPLTSMSVLAMQLSLRYSMALCCSSTSALRSWLSERSTSWMVGFTSGNRLMNLM